MLAAAALLLAAQASGSPDMVLARDTFASLCGDLSSEATVARAADAKGWAAAAPDQSRAIGRYHAMAAAWPGWKGSIFRGYRKTIDGRVADALVFDVRADAEIGAGLHCAMWLDEARVTTVRDVLRWGGAESTGLGLMTPPTERDRFLQWRDPGVFATHDITTVEIGPEGSVHIWSINQPEGGK